MEADIHAAAAGFDHLEWLTSGITGRTTRFVLLEMRGEDAARKRWRARGVDVEKELRRKAERVDTVEVDLWDPAAVGAALGRLSRDGPVAVNVSTGPNTVAVGATLSAMFWDVQPYHVDSTRPELTFEVPVIKERWPSDAVLTVLKEIAGRSGPASSAALKSALAGQELFRTGGARGNWGKRQPTRHAIHGQFETLVRPLLAWGAIKESRRGQRRWLEATQRGRSLLRLLEPDL